MSWKCEATDGSGYASNALRFETKQEAVDYGHELMSRWLACVDTRPATCDEPVNYRFVDGKAERLPSQGEAEEYACPEPPA